MPGAVVNKRNDPNYTQISGHIPKDLARKFKAEVAMSEVDHSEAIEESVREWLEKRQRQQANPES